MEFVPRSRHGHFAKKNETGALILLYRFQTDFPRDYEYPGSLTTRTLSHRAIVPYVPENYPFQRFYLHSRVAS